MAPLGSLGWDLPAGAAAQVAAGPAEAPSTGVLSAAQRQQRLEGWFREHVDLLWRVAARLGVPHANVDDVVQEAFITAERRAETIASGNVRAFLVGVTVKLCANQRRRQRTQVERFAQLASEPASEGPADAEQLLARAQLRGLLDLALDTLPSEQRAALVLHEVEGFTAAEIAELLGERPGTIASRLRRARARFTQAAARLRAEWLEQR